MFERIKNLVIKEFIHYFREKADRLLPLCNAPYSDNTVWLCSDNGREQRLNRLLRS